MKILAIIVTYYPNFEDVTNNILCFIDFVDKLIIWHNSPFDNKQDYNINFREYNEKVVHLHAKKNMGIAYALNQAYDLMMNDSNSYTHLLTMDQDSRWINFKDFRKKINVLSRDAIYSPNINNELKPFPDKITVKTCITSGAIFPIDVLREIGKFNVIYSVDCVDYDFCFRAYRKGVKIIKLTRCSMMQIYGDPLKSKLFRIKTNQYSPERLFFIVRNHIFLWKDYPEQMDLQFKKMILNSYIFGKIAKIILMEENKVKKVLSIIKGAFIGLLNDRSDTY